MKTIARKIMIIVFLLAVVSGLGVVDCFCQEKVIKEMVIKVKNNIIALPAGEAALIPLSAARVRSTELRELNKAYNTVSIEKLYELKKSSRGAGSSIKGLKKAVEASDDGSIDLGSVFTKEIKKEKEAAGVDVKMVKNSYILRFEFESEDEVNMGKLVADYKALDVVLFAQDVVRVK